jgi:hypothetical protein
MRVKLEAFNIMYGDYEMDDKDFGTDLFLFSVFNLSSNSLIGRFAYFGCDANDVPIYKLVDINPSLTETIIEKEETERRIRIR